MSAQPISSQNFPFDGALIFTKSDEEFASLLTHSLEKSGVKIWTDLPGLHRQAGFSLAEMLSEGICQSATLLFILSPAAIDSSWCLESLELAEKAGTRILIIDRGLVERERTPLPLQKRQWIKWQGEETLSSLVATLKASSTRQTETANAIQIIEFQGDGPAGQQLYQLPCTSDLVNVLTTATVLSRRSGREFHLSFGSVLLSFLSAKDFLSKWFQGFVRDTGVNVDQILQKRRLTKAEFKKLIQEPVWTEPNPKWRMTYSVTAVLEAATTLKPSGIHDQPFDVRHFMAAIVYRPEGHEGELNTYGFNRISWSIGFLKQIAERFPDEHEHWRAIHANTFGTPPITGPVGPSPHIATDVWTTTDALGYEPYAHAIFRFITHSQTKSPLTISIQAPWGGGKTSLMRMIQRKLDPDAFKDVKDEASSPRGEFSVRQVLQEIDTWIAKHTQAELPPTPKQNSKLLTVWFNAWKYESSNQVWAGLADAIMQQVAARLPLLDRERFWLRLNFKRVDPERVRRKIYDRVFSYWWRESRTWVFGTIAAVAISAFAALCGWNLSESWLQSTGAIGTIVSIISGVGVLGFKFKRADGDVKSEPAAVSLNDLLDIPKYATELGFVHHVEADLRRVLASVPDEYRPIVIFIDDLDRCAPQKVAQVIEAINLFLAGDFPKCVFVIGMDTEMVAAALQAAHKDMIACLPTDVGIPVGWRFMDKFVQLPFLIPPTEKDGVVRYASSLFAFPAALGAIRSGTGKGTVRPSQAPQQHPVATIAPTPSQPQDSIAPLQLSEEEVRRKLDEGINQFSDDNPDVQLIVNQAAQHFRGNPRELKRFINVFRFHYFIWWARQAQSLPAPTLEQVVRWTIFSMKWPEVIRWLRRGSRNNVSNAVHQSSSGTPPDRLLALEQLASQSASFTEWQSHASRLLRLTPEKTLWLSDEDLYQFFASEASEAAALRLSRGAGKGLW